MQISFKSPFMLAMAIFTCSLWFCTNGVVQAASSIAPQADGRSLTSDASPLFHAKQDAYVDANGHVEELYIVAGNPWHVADLSALTGAPAANGKVLVGLDSPQFRSKQYAYLDRNGHVEELYIVAGGSWHVADLSALTGAPIANGITLTTIDSPQFYAKQYAYVDTNGHVEELYIASGSWHVADLSAITGAPVANGVTLTASDSPQFHAKQYAYVDTHGHIEELYIASNAWHVADLSALTGAPIANGVTLAALDSPQFHAKQYVYVDTKGHVEELYIVSGNPWHVADLSALTGAPIANGVTLAALDSPQFHAKQYVYVDTHNHIEELYIVSGNPWHVADLSALTGAPVANGVTLAASDSPQFNSKQYTYVDTNGHVEELYIVSGNPWYFADLSALT